MTLTRYALSAIAALTGLLATTPAQAGGALFDQIPNALPPACNGGGCWTNHLRMTDIDGDDDLDVIAVNYDDFFAGANDPEPLAVFINDGTGSFTNQSASTVGDFAGNVRQIAVGDVDGDGDRDIYVPDGIGGPHVLFINDGGGVFVDEADARLPMGNFPRAGATRMGDLDDDGDLDIIAADGYANNPATFGHVYINDGTGVFTELMDAAPTSLSGIDIDDLDLFDVDGDMDLDAFANAHTNGTGNLWINDGTGVFTSADLPPPGNGGNHYNPGVCDVDGDGDLDIWIDNIGGGYNEQLLINDGNGNFTDETAARVTGNDGGWDDNGIICADIDNDGDFDGVVLSLFMVERYLENDGNGNFTYSQGAFPGPADCTLWGEMGDLNGDGRFDLVTGQGECQDTNEQVYLANQGIAADTQAPGYRMVEQLENVEPDVAPVLHFAVYDRSVTDEGPRLDRAFAVIDPGGADTVIDAVFMGGDLFRAVLPAAPDGTSVSYNVCAEDLAANIECSTVLMYQVGEAGPGDDTTGDGADTTDGNPNTSDPTETAGDVTGPGTGDSSGSSGETDTAGAGGGGDGCGCRQRPADGGTGWMMLGLLGLASLRRRRG